MAFPEYGCFQRLDYGNNKSVRLAKDEGLEKMPLHFPGFCPAVLFAPCSARGNWPVPLECALSVTPKIIFTKTDCKGEGAYSERHPA